MADNVSNGFAYSTPGRPRRAFRLPQLSLEDSDCEEERSPCRPRSQSILSTTALQDASSRANIQRSFDGQGDLNLGDVMADLTETCHISTRKFSWSADKYSADAMHAGRATSLPYPPSLFRGMNTMRSARRSSSSVSTPPQSPLESPITSASTSPTAALLDDPFDKVRRPEVLYGSSWATSTVSSTGHPEPESELGSDADADTDIDSEAEPEADQHLWSHTRQDSQSSRAPTQREFYKHRNARVNPSEQVPTTTAGASQRARETSTPMVRHGYMYHSSNRSAIGISFSETDSEIGEENDTFDKEGTSPAPAPHALRSSFSRAARMWIPPSKVRRTQSMFVTPEQLLHEQVGHIARPMNRMGQPEDTYTGVVGGPSCPLSTYTVKQDPFKRIDHRTLCKLLDGEFSQMFSEVIVIDCRFEYEYEGGHISGAVNVNSKKQLEQVLFEQRQCGFDQSVLLVFHCEHSAYRSPLLASHLRQWDRHLNAPHYPRLFYPDVVVLDGGYSEFYSASSQRCEPQNYIGMDHQEHREACEREMLKFRSAMRARKMPTAYGGGSTPNLLDFRFPKPAPALRSASVADLDLKNTDHNGANIFGL